ncbi:uncharacterized protein LOC143614112 [Bidens hawaiensis]|uniref:uncharacterized protein LOC143614112 n=1 Tax=Bidens hawaiensis TaxID=980011 RepID=UPI0040498654
MKGELSLVELGGHFRIEESLRTFETVDVNDVKKQAGQSVNMVEDVGTSKGKNKYKGKHKFQGNNNTGPNKKAKEGCSKCGKPGHFKRGCRVGKVNNNGLKNKYDVGPSGSKDQGKQQGQNIIHNFNSVENYVSLISETCFVQDNDVAWWVKSGATSHVFKNFKWFEEIQDVEEGSILKMGNLATEPIKGLGKVKQVFTSGNCLCLDNVLYVLGIRKNLFSGVVLNNCGYKQVYESDKYILSRHGSRNEIQKKYEYCFNIEEDPKTYSEAMASQDIAFWKEAINDEMDFIMQNNTWKLSDLLLGCKPLGCKWIFKKKMKVDGSIDKFKSKLVIQAFRQKEGIDYFDTYAPVARISKIRLLIALAAIHNLVIHQMDVKLHS